MCCQVARARRSTLCSGGLYSDLCLTIGAFAGRVEAACTAFAWLSTSWPVTGLSPLYWPHDRACCLRSSEGCGSEGLPAFGSTWGFRRAWMALAGCAARERSDWAHLQRTAGDTAHLVAGCMHRVVCVVYLLARGWVDAPACTSGPLAAALECLQTAGVEAHEYSLHALRWPVLSASGAPAILMCHCMPASAGRTPLSSSLIGLASGLAAGAGWAACAGFGCKHTGE